MTAQTHKHPGHSLVGWLASRQAGRVKRTTLKIMAAMLAFYALHDVEPGAHVPERSMPRRGPVSFCVIRPASSRRGGTSGGGGKTEGEAPHPLIHHHDAVTGFA